MTTIKSFIVKSIIILVIVSIYALISNEDYKILTRQVVQHETY